MTDKKPTDNEVVKALRCCGRNSIAGWLNDCKNCPLNDRTTCIPELIYKALDLINRLQAENENYSKNNQQMTKDILDLYKALEQAKAKNERLKDNGKLESENIVLNSLIEMKNDTIGNQMKVIDMLERQLKTAKAKAYKEFADKVHTEIEEALKSNYKAKGERLEKHNVGDSTDFISYCEGKIAALRGIDDFIDNLLKELVGE